MASVPDLVSLAVNAPGAPSPPTPARPGLPGLHPAADPSTPPGPPRDPATTLASAPNTPHSGGSGITTPRAGFGRTGRRTVCEGPLPEDVAGTAPQAPLCFGEHVLGWPYSCTSVGGSQSTLSVPFSPVSVAQARAGGSSRRGRVRLAPSRLFRPSSWAQCCDGSSHVWTCLGHEVPRCVVKPQP